MMPSMISHAVVSVAAGVTFVPREGPNHFWSLALICSIIPDVDSIGFSIGIPYPHLFSHRGFFHSPFFGLLLGLFFVSVFFRGVELFSRGWFFYLLFSFLLTGSYPPRCLDEWRFGSCSIVSFRSDKVFSALETDRGFTNGGCPILQPMGLGRDQK